MPSRASTSRSFSAGADVSSELAPAAVARGATVIDNSSAWRMDPTIPLVVSQVNPDDLEGHPGIIANPNCSTMQLAPVLMALRDTVGLERVVVDTYQSVSGTGADAMAELESQIRAHVAGEAPVASVYPHPIAFNALPEIDVFLANGYTKEEWKVVTREPQDPRPARTCASRARRSASRSSSATPRPIHVETREPITPGAGSRAVRRRARASSSRTTRPSIDYPLATEAAGRDEDLRRPRPARSSRSPTTAVSRFWVVSDNLRKGAATNARRDRRDPPRARTGSSQRRPAAPGRTERPAPMATPRPRRDRRRAPGGARGDRRRGPGLHELPSRTRPGRRPSRARATPTPRSSSSARAGLQRGPPGTAVRRPRRRPAGQAPRHRSAGGARTCSSPTSSSAGRRTTATRSPTRSPPARRTCGASSRSSIRRVVVTLGRYSMGDVHARRADLAGARHGPAGRSGDGRRVGARVRDVPPGRRAADAGHRARQLRRHRRGPGRARCASRAAAAARPRESPAARRQPHRSGIRARTAPIARADPPTATRRRRHRRRDRGRRRPPADPLLTSQGHRCHRPTTTSRSGSSRSAGWARSARTCTSSSTATRSWSSTAA